MTYRLKICYRRNYWKLTPVEYPTLEAAKESQKKLAAMGVKSKLCDFTGKELE